MILFYVETMKEIMRIQVTQEEINDKWWIDAIRLFLNNKAHDILMEYWFSTDEIIKKEEDSKEFAWKDFIFYHQEGWINNKW